MVYDVNALYTTGTQSKYAKYVFLISFCAGLPSRPLSSTTLAWSKTQPLRNHPGKNCGGKVYSILFLRFLLSAIEECVVYSQFAYSRNMLWRQGNMAAVGNALRGLKNKPILETFVSILWCCYGMASIFSHLAKNLSPDCSFRWSLCVQSHRAP